MNQYQTIQPKIPTAYQQADDLLDAAVSQSQAFSRFLDGARSSGSRLLVVINDPHRSTQTQEALNAVARYLAQRQEDIRCHILVATGTHKIALPERQLFEKQLRHGLALKVGDITWHDSDKAENLARIGDFHFNRLLKEYDYLLAVGSVEPHYFAGLTGAHKTLTVGCLSRMEIEDNHQQALSEASHVLALSGNPVHDGITNMLAALAGESKTFCCINQVVCGDRLIEARAGDPLATLAQLAPVAERVFVHRVEVCVDWVELHVPLPLGRSLYQADKALKNNHGVVRVGGGMILVAPCPEGIGEAAFLNLLRRTSTHAEALSLVQSAGYRLGDHKAVKLRYLTDPRCQDVHVAIVAPGLSATDARAAGLTPFSDVQQARQWLKDSMVGASDHGLIVQDAGFVVVQAKYIS